MKRLHLVLLFLTISPGASGEDIDWRQIATETDEPSYALEIIQVTPGSQAARLRLKSGDYFMQVGHQLVREFGLRRSGGEDRFFFVRKGGREEEAVVKGGVIGLRFREAHRPWLGYLRGEIGTSDPKWDDAVVKALELMREAPEEAIEEWEKAVTAGYQKDELSAFFDAYTKWRLGRIAPVQKAFDAILKEFEVIPFVYYVGLEDMAIAFHELDILRALHELDPDSSTLKEADIEKWEQISDEDSPASPVVLATIGKRHHKRITPELTLGDKEGTKGIVSPDFLIKNKPLGASPGHYRLSHLAHPDGITKLHLRMKFRIASFGNHSRNLSAARLRLYSKTGDDETIRISETMVEAPESGDSYLSFFPTGSTSRRRFRLPEISIPRLKSEKEDFGSAREDIPEDPQNLSDLITLDLVCDEKSVAVYCNRVALSDLPHPRNLKDLAVSFHVSGVAVVPESFDVWTLK
ncbi:MAG: hypothetical protein P1U86_05000 [Verrucomicrobiales bacterium]|nr:hypothetical protein [Verrucomicrobiales bacterium]